MKIQQFFYDTGKTGQWLFGPGFWENLRDSLSGGPYVIAPWVEIEAPRIVASPTATAKDLDDLTQAYVELRLPAVALMRQDAGRFKLSEAELKRVSARVTGVKHETQVTIALQGWSTKPPSPQRFSQIPIEKYPGGTKPKTSDPGVVPVRA